jgi:hypothetical protein
VPFLRCSSAAPAVARYKDRKLVSSETMVTVRQEAQPRRRWRKKRERLRDEVAGDRIFAIELLISY